MEYWWGDEGTDGEVGCLWGRGAHRKCWEMELLSGVTRRGMCWIGAVLKDNFLINCSVLMSLIIS